MGEYLSRTYKTLKQNEAQLKEMRNKLKNISDFGCNIHSRWASLSNELDWWNSGLPKSFQCDKMLHVAASHQCTMQLRLLPLSALHWNTVLFFQVYYNIKWRVHTSSLPEAWTYQNFPGVIPERIGWGTLFCNSIVKISMFTLKRDIWLPSSVSLTNYMLCSVTFH